MAVETFELTGSAVQGIGPHVRALTDLPVKVRLGRIKPVARPMALSLGAYLDETVAAINPPPPSTNRRAKAAASIARMYLNDQLGDCVVAAKMHALGLWSGADATPGGVVLASDQEVSDQYQAICGPGDQGCVITNVLDVMRTKGIVAGGKPYTIDGYVSADWRNKLMWQVGIFLFGASSIGFDLPNAWLNSDTWDVTNSRTVGGHCVVPIDYSEQGVFVASWGRIYLMTWAAAMSTKWISELYFMLAPLWYGDDRLAPSGVNVQALQDDFAKIGGDEVPPIPGPTPPVIPPSTLPPLLVAQDAAGKQLGRYKLEGTP